MSTEPTPPLSHQIVDRALVVLIRATLGIMLGGLLGFLLVAIFDRTPGLDGAIHVLVGIVLGALIGLVVGLFLAQRRLKGRGANIFPA